MADFIIDTETLRQAAQNVSSITREFTDANSRVDTAAHAAGHWVLEQAIVDFAGGWDQHRKELLEQMGELTEILNSGAETIDEADATLASNLEESC
jgi:uncharacterized protein YukE